MMTTLPLFHRNWVNTKKLAVQPVERISHVRPEKVTCKQSLQVPVASEEIGDTCESCSNSVHMCGCVKCERCKDKWDEADITQGFCPDCVEDFQYNPQARKDWGITA